MFMIFYDRHDVMFSLFKENILLKIEYIIPIFYIQLNQALTKCFNIYPSVLDNVHNL